MLGITATALGGTLYVKRFETGRLLVERTQVPITGLPEAFAGFRLVHLSDFHLDSDSFSYTLARRAVELAMELAPDMAVLTGDYVTDYLDAEAARDIFASLSAPHGVWCSLGNHDHWFDSAAVREVIAASGIAELRNAATRIERGEERIWLAGVDDIWEQHHDLGAALAGVPVGAPVILLAHEPDYADEAAADGRVTLQLSGHSHGGQAIIPGRGAVALPYLARRYWQGGLHSIGALQLYISRGVGSLGTMRPNCPPEVTELTLVPA
jgi:hypothetical protein